MYHRLSHEHKPINFQRQAQLLSSSKQIRKKIPQPSVVCARMIKMFCQLCCQVDSRPLSPNVRGPGSQSSSPYSHGMESARYSPAARIPPPPPLITSNNQRSSPKQARSPPTSSSSHLLIPGSITRGTPVTHPQPAGPIQTHPMASLVRPAASPQQGSITKGTPMREMGRGVYEGGQYRGPHSSMYGKQGQYPAVSAPSYGQYGQVEQNQPYSSRAIIMNDYYTAQQMPRGQKGEREDGIPPRVSRDSPHPHASAPRHPPPDPRHPLGAASGQGMVYMMGTEGRGKTSPHGMREEKVPSAGWPQG